MTTLYQVFESSALPGEVVMVGEFGTLPEAAAVALAGVGRTVEYRSGGTARVVDLATEVIP